MSIISLSYTISNMPVETTQRWFNELKKNKAIKLYRGQLTFAKAHTFFFNVYIDSKFARPIECAVPLQFRCMPLDIITAKEVSVSFHRYGGKYLDRVCATARFIAPYV